MIEGDITCGLPIYSEAVASVHHIEAFELARNDKLPNFQDNILLTIAAEAASLKDKVLAIGSMSYRSLANKKNP